MTNNEEVEKVAKELYVLHFGVDDDSFDLLLPDDLKEPYIITARWHIREKQIAVLEARIDELERRRKGVRYGQIVNILDIRAEARIAHIKSQLTALKKDSDK